MTTPRVLVLGTRNLKKLRELEELLQWPELQLQTLAAFPEAVEVEEDGTTFYENAAKKAVTLAKQLGQWVLGEDSGLCVAALAGAPGIFSARFAGLQRDDAANNAKLLVELTGVPEAQRDAYYICTAIIADPTGSVRATAEGRCAGRILESPAGSNGFGYDPLFFVPEAGQTFGELPPDYKRQHSHRARAIAQLRPALLDLFS